MPDPAPVVAKHALATLRTNERAQGFIHDLAFGFKTREFACLADQAFVNVDIGPAHKNTIHHFLDKLCIRSQGKSCAVFHVGNSRQAGAFPEDPVRAADKFPRTDHLEERGSGQQKITNRKRSSHVA